MGFGKDPSGQFGGQTVIGFLANIVMALALGALWIAFFLISVLMVAGLLALIF